MYSVREDGRGVGGAARRLNRTVISECVSKRKRLQVFATCESRWMLLFRKRRSVDLVTGACGKLESNGSSNGIAGNSKCQMAKCASRSGRVSAHSGAREAIVSQTLSRPDGVGGSETTN